MIITFSENIFVNAIYISYFITWIALWRRISALPHKRKGIKRKLLLCGTTVPFCSTLAIYNYYKAKSNKVLMFQQHSIITVKKKMAIWWQRVLFLLFKEFLNIPISSSFRLFVRSRNLLTSLLASWYRYGSSLIAKRRTKVHECRYNIIYNLDRNF